MFRHYLICCQTRRCVVNEAGDCSDGSKILLLSRQLNAALEDWPLPSISLTEFLNDTDLRQTFHKWPVTMGFSLHPSPL